MQNHVLILSDGYGNLGVTDVGELRQRAMNLRSRGMLTSTVGIGDGYSPEQLSALSVYGGGRMHDAQHPGEIIEVVLGQMRELAATIIDDVVVEIDFPLVHVIKNLSGFPSKINDFRVSTFFGSLVAKASRTCVFRIETPAGVIGKQFEVRISSSFRRVGSDKSEKGAEVKAILAFTDKDTNAKQLRNLPISTLVARTWQAAIVRHVVELNRLQKYEESLQYLDKNLERFIAYCDGLMDTAMMVNELVHMRRVANVKWDERSRKEMQLASYQQTYSHVDTRSVKRDAWSTFLPKSGTGEK